MVLAGEIEELRTQLEAAERARKAAESELHEASDRVGDLSNSNSSLATQKRKLENDIQAMQVGRHHRSVVNILDSLLANQIPAKGVVTIVCRIEIRKMASC